MNTIQLAASNGKYGSWQYGGSINGLGDKRGPAVVFDKDDAGAWESPVEEANDDGTFSWQVGGFYLTAENGGGGAVSTNRTVKGAWEKFTKQVRPDGAGVNIQCCDGIHFLRVDPTVRPVLTADGPDATAWQTFIITGEAPSVAARGAWTKSQLMDIQGDLMIWMPELAPQFVNGIDPVTGIHEHGDGGSTPAGIHAGWIWTLWIPWYSADKRQQIYAKIRDVYHFTHVAIEVTQIIPGTTGYHGLRPISQTDADGWASVLNTVHQEILDAGLIPMCTGVSPLPGDGPVQPGFDTSKALIAISDWDNTNNAAQRIAYLAANFPSTTLLYFERPQNGNYPQPDPSPGDPTTPMPTGSSEWLRPMRQKYPNFTGVLYEVDHNAGLDSVQKELTMCDPWWSNVQQVLFEVDTYYKFWDNLDIDGCRVFNDAVLAKCPQLRGCMSGATAHPVIVAAPLPAGATGSPTPASGTGLDGTEWELNGVLFDHQSWPGKVETALFNLLASGLAGPDGLSGQLVIDAMNAMGGHFAGGEFQKAHDGPTGDPTYGFPWFYVSYVIGGPQTRADKRGFYQIVPFGQAPTGN
jgi:hypothetical protein